MLAISHPLTNQRPRLPWGASQRHSSVIESSPPSSSFQTKPTLSRVRSISNFLLSSHLVCSRQGASHALPLGIVAIFLEGALRTSQTHSVDFDFIARSVISPSWSLTQCDVITSPSTSVKSFAPLPSTNHSAARVFLVFRPRRLSFHATPSILIVRVWQNSCHKHADVTS